MESCDYIDKSAIWRALAAATPASRTAPAPGTAAAARPAIAPIAAPLTARAPHRPRRRPARPAHGPDHRRPEATGSAPALLLSATAPSGTPTGASPGLALSHDLRDALEVRIGRARLPLVIVIDHSSGLAFSLAVVKRRLRVVFVQIVIVVVFELAIAFVFIA